ncbi:MAG: hypothetical protein B5766_00550 [Candidatus Lumbricidophila eiseniae]|uniref:Uncharacterized protein n=1 Tax=Candidatus Lumbricidiphila eiseniae TaxID=1969409 RepID=A0A2A6FUD2_9MICO|nr:MAG: hypothetical protein B5766_00550 [Candidatus Lumbricidophila eiseniae]
MSATSVMTTPAPVVDQAAREKAISYVTTLMSRYEAELEVQPTTDAGLAHIAIVLTQLEDWRGRLARLRSAA